MALFKDVIETVRMIEKENLDIRTTTMGISLMDCIDSDGERCRKKIYDKITRLAENLVVQADRVATEFGISIVNKRISVTPISLVAGATNDSDYVAFAETLDHAAKTVGVNFIGGFSALVPKGFTKGDLTLIRSIPEALAVTENVCSSVNLGSTKTGINMDAVKIMGDIVKQTAYLTRDADSIGCAKLVIFCNAVEDNPFMAGAYHGVGEPDTVLHVGVSGPASSNAPWKNAPAPPSTRWPKSSKKQPSKSQGPVSWWVPPWLTVSTYLSVSWTYLWRPHRKLEILWLEF